MRVCFLQCAVARLAMPFGLSGTMMAQDVVEAVPVEAVEPESVEVAEPVAGDGKNEAAEPESNAGNDSSAQLLQDLKQHFRRDLDNPRWNAPASVEVSIRPDPPDEAELRQARGRGRSHQTGIGSFLAIGQASEDVVFFSYESDPASDGADGHTTAIYAADRVLRTDRSRLEIEDLEAEIAGSSADTPMTWIAVAEATWYLDLNLLFSEAPTELRRPNLRVLGHGCRYSGDSEVIEMYGATETYLYLQPADMAGAVRSDPLAP